MRKVVTEVFNPRQDEFFAWVSGIGSGLSILISSFLFFFPRNEPGFALILGGLVGLMLGCVVGLAVYNSSNTNPLFDEEVYFFGKAKKEYTILEKNGNFFPGVNYWGNYYYPGLASFHHPTQEKLQEWMRSNIEKEDKDFVRVIGKVKGRE